MELYDIIYSRDSSIHFNIGHCERLRFVKKAIVRGGYCKGQL